MSEQTGHKLRNLLLSEHTEPKPTLMGDSISDEQLADCVSELRETIAEIGSGRPKGMIKEADVALDDLILNLVERIEGARIEGFQMGLEARYRAVQDLLANFYGFPVASPVPEEQP